MPRPLERETIRWNGRLFADDLATFETIYGPGNVNAVIRALVEMAAKRLREQSSLGPNP